MQDFLERSDLGNGISWTAEYQSWDWARNGLFYFRITISRGDEIIKQINAAVDDYAYGDPSCRYNEEEIRRLVKSELHSLAARGESNTEYV